MIKHSKAIALSLTLLATAALPGCHARAGDSSAASAQSGPQNEMPLSEAGLRQVPLSVKTSDAVHRFTVEVAESAAEQAQGLMFRTRLAPDEGMIFPFAKDRIASFWMKNTVISLDIIFVRRDGTIESIAANTTPYSLESVRSGEPVAAVFEIAAGRAAELGIEPGDKITWQ
ncbi:DUF192 domain-containing protein [Sphingorhabdus sp. 109]|jgi:uncharacterized membrane protein (UPF0127 family)|uniref:DUF192 domain-containing protein n=1 Tax=Sphingorhabdus sp. 109 TaxID=2653173 RepID=UPI0012F1DCCA|nr:DUF192 domain-containing protein [Sphingorhabdus sp. 109]VWX61349.1 putative ACR [Sphingorhabdus sp. 109]